MCFMHTVTALLLLCFSLNFEHDSISEEKEEFFFFVRIIVWLELKQPFSLFLSYFFNILRFIFSCLPFHFILTIFLAISTLHSRLLFSLDLFLYLYSSIYSLLSPVYPVLLPGTIWMLSQIEFS